MLSLKILSFNKKLYFFFFFQFRSPFINNNCITKGFILLFSFFINMKLKILKKNLKLFKKKIFNFLFYFLLI